MLTITSTTNPKIKDAIQLRKASERKKQGLVVIEGRKELEQAINSGIELRTVFWCKSYGGLLSDIDPAIVFVVSEDVFARLSQRESPDGILAVAVPRPLTLGQIRLGSNPLVMVLEAMEKPGNLGAILRTADFAGVDAVIVCDPHTDIYNANVIRASRGTVFSVQLAMDTTAVVQKWLAINKLRVYAASPEASKVYTAADLTQPIAIVMGCEDTGLSADWDTQTVEHLSIPGKGIIDSLNVSVCAAVMLFEAVRQRQCPAA